MIATDLWAAGAATIAASAIAIRARMLRPHQRAWTHAPPVVWGTLSLLGLTLAMRAMQLWFGAHATAGEAIVDSSLAVSSLAMLWNLNRHGREAEVQRQRIAQGVEAMMKASGPPPAYQLGRRRHG